MGVIIRSEIILNNGLTVTNAYASIGSSEIKTIKDHFSYVTSATIKVWVSREARDAGSHPIKEYTTSHSSETPPSENIYTLLYDRFKSRYNFTFEDVYE